MNCICHNVGVCGAGARPKVRGGRTCAVSEGATVEDEGLALEQNTGREYIQLLC